MQKESDDRVQVYEIGYLIASSVAEEGISAEVDKIKKIINDSGASIVAEETPHIQPLAYTMRIKTVSGSYEKYDRAYFGWVKFELSSVKVDGVKKAIEEIPSMLRVLLVVTVKENTYLGKRASIVAQDFNMNMTAPVKRPRASGKTDEKVETVEASPATVEEMDKSIDEMVKEV